MRITLLALASLCIIAVGCNEPEKKDKPVGNHQVGNAIGDTGETKLDKPESESDRQVTLGIRKALADSPTVAKASRNVKVHTREGVVHLRGTVSSEKDKQEIVQLVTKTPGVKKVEDFLEVSPQ